jgi:hypothetical protein
MAVTEDEIEAHLSKPHTKAGRTQRAVLDLLNRHAEGTTGYRPRSASCSTSWSR